MRASAWNNSSYSATGGGYGFLLRGDERDQDLQRGWGTIRILLEEPDRWAEANIDKDSFWNRDIAELISQDIGIWLLERGLAPWKSGTPPVFELEHMDGNRFRLRQFPAVAASQNGDPRTSSRRRREHLLDAIQREHILQAIKLFDEGHSHAFAESTKFDLAYDGRPYPPKAIIGLAGVPLYGEPLKPDDFTGGAGSKCFRVLSREGFEVVPKVSEFRPTADQDELERRTREAMSAPILPKPAGQVAPRQVSRETQTYERDPLVRAFVLRRAKGKCECCGKDAPFVDRDGEPFLEVHHIQPLAQGGGDVVDNAAAICPNCHRECHHGRNLLQLRQHLLDRAGSFANAESSAADG
jgi:hypothetical protein